MNLSKVNKKRQMWSNDTGEFRNGCQLDLHLCVGNTQSPMHKDIYFIGEDTVYYLCGKHVVLYDISKQKQTYLVRAQADQHPTAFNFALGKQKQVTIALALAATQTSLPLAKLYFTDGTPPLSLVHSHLDYSASIFQLAFLKKNKVLLTLASYKGDTILSAYSTVTGTLSSQLTLPSTPSHMLPSPYDPDDFTLAFLNSQLNLFKLDASSEKFQQELKIKGEDQPIVDHCWLMRWGVLVVAYPYRIVFYRNFNEFQQIKAVEQLNLKEEEDGPVKVSALGHTHRGIFVGFENHDEMLAYDLDKNDQVINKGKYRLTEKEYYCVKRVASFHTSEDKMYMAISVLYAAKNKSVQHQTLNMDKLELYYFNIAMHDAIKVPYNNIFENVFDLGSHKGPVIQTQVSTNRNVIATLGEDKVLKFWEFNGVEIHGLFQYQFLEQGLCMGLHPLANQCCVGFREGVKFFYVLDDNIRQVFNESIKQCQAISYSEGGHVVAVGNQALILVFDAYSYSVQHTLQGHAGIIRNLSFMHRDRILMSVCAQGVVNCWSQKSNTWVRFREHAYKSAKYLDVTYDSVNNLIVCLCSDNRMRIFSGENNQMIFEYDSSPVSFTCMLLSSRYGCVFLGTSEGSVKCVLWPIQDLSTQLLESIEFPIHQEPVTSLRLTADNSHLISGSEDGSIFVTRLKEWVNGVDMASAEAGDAARFGENGSKGNKVYLMNNYSLVSKTGNDVKKELTKELEYKIQNLKSDIEDEKDKYIEQYNGTIIGLEKDNDGDFMSLQQRMEQIMEQEAGKHQRLAEDIEKHSRAHSKRVEAMEAENNERLLKCYRRNDELKAEKANLIEEYKQELEQEENNCKATIQKVQEDYDINYNKKYNKFNQALFEMQEDRKAFKEVMIQSDHENDLFLDQINKQLIQELDEEHRRSENLRKLNSKHAKGNDNFKARAIGLQQVIEDTQNQILQMKNIQAKFEVNNQNMLQQLVQKESVINQKEQAIKDYRSKNIHLQNFRSVYDYIVNNLKEEKGPLLEHLQNMDKHVKTMYKELLDEAASQRKLNEKNIELSQKMDSLRHEVKDKSSLLNQSQRKIEVFDYKVRMCIRDEDHLEWKEKLEAIYKEAFEDQPGGGEEEKDKGMKKDRLLEALEKNNQQAIQIEQIKQRDLLSKRLISLTQMNKKIEEDRDDIFVKIQSENTNLINECNNLRKDRYQLKRDLGFYQKSLKQITKQIEHLLRGEELSEAEEEPIIEDQSELIDMYHNRHVLDSKKANKARELPFAQYQRHAKEQSYLRPSASTMKVNDELASSNRLLADLLGKFDHKDSVEDKLSIEHLKQKVNKFLNYENVSLPQIHDSNLRIHCLLFKAAKKYQATTASPWRPSGDDPIHYNFMSSSAQRQFYQSLQQKYDQQIENMLNTLDTAPVSRKGPAQHHQFQQQHQLVADFIKTSYNQQTQAERIVEYQGKTKDYTIGRVVLLSIYNLGVWCLLGWLVYRYR